MDLISLAPTGHRLLGFSGGTARWRCVTFPANPNLLRMLGPVTDSPEVTSGAPIVPTSTRKDQSTISPMPLSSISPSSSDPSSKSSSNAGKIAGGVVGGLAVAALIAGIVFWFIIRRRRARTAPSSEFYIDGQSGTRREAAPYSSTIEALRAYVRLFFSLGHVRA